MPLIIGIGGCSRSGKTSLARKIKEQLSNQRVLLLEMDYFVLPESKIPKIKDHTDWERPESIDIKRLCQAIEDHRKDYDVIVVEGILVFAFEELRKLFDTTVWMQISKETFLERRKVETRWGKDPDWFLEHVWNSFLKYGQYPEADFILSGENQISKEVLRSIVS